MKKHTYFAANEEDGINLLFILEAIDAFPLLMQKHLKTKISFFLDLRVGHVRWCVDENAYRQAGAEILEKAIINKDYLKNLRKNCVKYADQLINLVKKVDKVNIQKCSGRELISYVEKHYWLYLKMVEFGLYPVLMELSNDLFTNYLLSLIAKKIPLLKSSKPASEYFQILTDFHLSSAAQLEYQDRIKLAIAIEKGRFSQQSEEFKKLLKKHTKKYFWLNYAYQGPILNEDYFSKALVDLLKKGDNDNLWGLLHYERQQAIQKAKNFLAELKFSQSEKRFLVAAKDIMYMKMYRKDACTFSLAIMEKVLKEISRRTGYSLAEIRHCHPAEFPALFKNKLKHAELEARLKYLAYYYQNGPKILTGSIAEKFVKDKMKIEIVSVEKELKGTTACLGQGTGKVKIINSVVDMVKMEQGNVLVSIATIPEIVPAMKKAVAIVTDIGGLTSHAAIVSRELKIPCVIGTKIATKVLHDGDTVEIDATHGIVRIINTEKKWMFTPH